ncbi:MAG: discoidin domain-containing protein, partial [candidate division WOR-3 bacterium]
VTVRLLFAHSHLKKGDLHKTAMIIDEIPPSIYHRLRDNEKDLLSNIYFALGDKFLKIGNLENAEKYLQSSLNISDMQNAKKGLAKIYDMKADAVFADKRYGDAQGLYEKALELDKGNLEYQEKLSKVKSIITSKRKKTTAAILVPLGVVAILIVAFFVWRHLTTGLISINYSSQEVARIEIDSKEYKSGFLRVKKGEHKISVKGNTGYSDTTIVIAISAGSKEIIPIGLRYILKKITGLSATASSYDAGGAWGGPYPPQYAIDGKTFTCWSEAHNEPCTGQWIKVFLPTKKSIVKIGILPGFDKYNPKYGDVYWLNNRLRTVELEFSDGRIYDLFFEDQKRMKYFEFQPPVVTEWIKLTVKSYYPGQRWDDICISEIEVWGY